MLIVKIQQIKNGRIQRIKPDLSKSKKGSLLYEARLVLDTIQLFTPLIPRDTVYQVRFLAVYNSFLKTKGKELTMLKHQTSQHKRTLKFKRMRELINITNQHKDEGTPMISKEFAEEWADALESGDYIQGDHSLYDSANKTFAVLELLV